MKEAIQGVVILIGFIAFSILACGAWGTRQAINAMTPPPPTPQPTPASEGAAIVREMAELLERINVGEAVGSGARANNANTQAVHTTGMGQFIQDIVPIVPWFILALSIMALVITVLSVLWFLVRAGEGRDLAQLIAALARLEALFKAAGVEAPGDNPLTPPKK